MLKNDEVPEPSITEIVAEIVVVEVKTNEGVHDWPGLSTVCADLADLVVGEVEVVERDGRAGDLSQIVVYT